MPIKSHTGIVSASQSSLAFNTQTPLHPCQWGGLSPPFLRGHLPTMPLRQPYLHPLFLRSMAVFLTVRGALTIVTVSPLRMPDRLHL